MSDYHLHLHPHTHRPASDAPPPGEYPPGYIDRYVEAALERGVTELGFTEHFYRCVESAPALGEWWEPDPNPELRAGAIELVRQERNLSLERYVEVVLDAKDRGLPVKLGLEVDFQPGTEEAVLDLIAGYPWDFLIDSVHWIGAWSFDRFLVAEEFARRGVRTVYEQYFALEAQLAASGMVDVLAHADIIKRNGYRPDGPIDDLYEPVVQGAVATGTAVEVSSAGLSRAAAEVYPGPRFLKMFHDAGVPITLASDAHVPADAGWGHAEVVAAAREAGYTHRLRFENRERTLVPLEDPPEEVSEERPRTV